MGKMLPSCHVKKIDLSQFFMRNRAFQLKAGCTQCDMGPLCAPAGLSSEEKRALQAATDQHFVLRKGEILEHVNDPVRCLYTLRMGCVKAWVMTEQAREKVIDFYIKGEIIGLDALGGQRYTSTLVSLEDSVVCRMQYRQLQQIMDQYPRIRSHLLTLASNKLNQRVATFQHQEAETRLVAFILDYQERLRKRFGHSVVQFKLPMSRLDIANYLDLTPETVSRVFTRLKNSGVIRLQGKFLQITSPEASH